MKEISLYIRPEKLELAKRVLEQFGCTGISVINVMGCGNQKGFAEEYRGVRTSINLLPKLKIEAVVPDDKVQRILQEIHGQLSTGSVGDGKVIVKAVEDLMRIRTGERGEIAL